jgi:hypothetical protein
MLQPQFFPFNCLLYNKAQSFCSASVDLRLNFPANTCADGFDSW